MNRCAFYLSLAVLTANAATPTAFVPVGPPCLSASFEGSLVDSIAGSTALTPEAEFVKGYSGQAVCTSERPVRFSTPDGFDWQRGTVAMWIRPATDCRDYTYRMFFEVEQASKSRVYLIKSGKGGSNGLFMCVVDEEGTWLSASVFPGKDYSWKAEDWIHIGGSWDATRGVLKLFFNGREVATKRSAPFRIGKMGNSFTIGAGPDGGSPFRGVVDEFRLHQEVTTHSPIVSAKNLRGTEQTAWGLIDGDRGDKAGWSGMGAPNWVEVELPQPEELARLIVYPGALCYAQYPSTECAPKHYVVEAWINDAWQAMSREVTVPRYRGEQTTHRVVTDLDPAVVRRFRLNISELYDKGCRISSPEKPIVLPPDCSVVLREIEWLTTSDLAEARRRFVTRRAEWHEQISRWTGLLERPGSSPVAQSVRQYYGPRIAAASARLQALLDHDTEALEAFAEQWSNISTWIEPWQTCTRATATDIGKTIGIADPVGAIEMRVEPGETARQFYPASVNLDLRIVRDAIGCEPNPYVTHVVEIDTDGAPVPFNPAREGSEKFLVPCRLDRTTPDQATLSWTLRDRSHTRFVVLFTRRTEAPPPAMGNVTLGNCDRLFFNSAGTENLPGNIWAATIVDWDGDGLQDIIAGRWTDYCHFWKNTGTKEEPVFAEREHWLLIDASGKPIVANRKHPGLGFSVPMPVDFDGDGNLDLFMHTYYGATPTFYRGLGPDRAPTVACGVGTAGLKAGRLAFGDLNGDNISDAIVVTQHREGDSIAFQPGQGLSHDARPTFGPEQPLTIGIERTPLVGCRTVPALADIDADGDLDLFLYAAPHVLKFENTGTADQFRFAPGEILEHDGKPLQLNDYYPWIAWSDWDADGDLDLVKCTGLSVLLNTGDAKCLKLGSWIRPKQKRQRAMGRAGLRAHAMVDWDADGDLDYVTLAGRGTDLSVTLSADGLLTEHTTVSVDPNRLDWFGCPDPTEYYSLYGNVKLVDWDGDGDLDLFVTSEHSWRFGYIHYYRNLGGYTFAPEVELRPDPRCDYVKFVPGVDGQAALVDQQAHVDFLSFRTKDNFDPNGGTISFHFKPGWDADDGQAHYLFCTARHPEHCGVSSHDLKQYYTGMKPEVGRKLSPPFALWKTEGGSLRFQTWDTSLDTGKLTWRAAQWHSIAVTWSESGRRIVIDGQEAARAGAPAKVMPIGARMHIGSNQTLMIQRQREYASRRPYHPKDWTFIAEGAFDHFEIRDPAGTPTMTLRFDGNCDSDQGLSGGRTTVGYRCTPGFADLNGDGLLDMVMMIADGTRPALGALYLFSNLATATEPRLGTGRLLEHADGKPFRCHMRTQVTAVDWDRDGLLDLMLSTENCGQRTNCAVDLFRNVGTRTDPVFADRAPMNKLNAMIEPHHEVKLCAVDMTGNGVEDLVTSTDPGTRVIYRSYLDEEPVTVRLLKIARAASGQ